MSVLKRIIAANQQQRDNIAAAGGTRAVMAAASVSLEAADDAKHPVRSIEVRTGPRGVEKALAKWTTRGYILQTHVRGTLGSDYLTFTRI